MNDPTSPRLSSHSLSNSREVLEAPEDQKKDIVSSHPTAANMTQAQDRSETPKSSKGSAGSLPKGGSQIPKDQTVQDDDLAKCFQQEKNHPGTSNLFCSTHLMKIWSKTSLLLQLKQ